MSSLVKSIVSGAQSLAKNLLGVEPPPQAPAIPPPPPAAGLEGGTPTVGAADEAVTKRESEDARLRKKGRAAYLLGGQEGYGTPTTAAKALTGE